MIEQTDPQLNAMFPGFGDTGCALMLPFWTAFRFKGTYIDRAVMAYHIQKWLDDGAVGEGYYVNDWTAIHETLGIKVLYHGHTPPRGTIRENQFAYGYWKKIDEEVYHFTALNADGWVSYDPLGDSNVVKWGALETYRLFTLL